MFDKIFQIVQAIDNSQGLKVLEQLVKSLGYVMNVLNSDEVKDKKNELIDDLIAMLQTHKDKPSTAPSQAENNNG